MPFRLPGRRASLTLVLTSALALACASCTTTTASDNGPLDIHSGSSAFPSESPSTDAGAPSTAPSTATVTPVKHTATQPIKTFAARSCHDTVFAQVGGDNQYGFTACGAGAYSPIYAIVGDGLKWKLTKLKVSGVPLGAAGGAYLLYSAKPVNVSILHRPAKGKVNGFTIQQGPANTFSGAIASGAGWWADWSEPKFGKVWQAHTLRGSESARAAGGQYAQHLSLTLLHGGPMLAWVESGGLYVGKPKGPVWTRSRVTPDQVGPPVAFVVGGRLAIAYPDDTTNQAKVALSQGSGWRIRTMGSLGASDTSLVSAGASGAKAVVAWQTATGLAVARLTGAHWATTTYATAQDRALAASGTAVVRADGSVLLLGTKTSRIIG